MRYQPDHLIDLIVRAMEDELAARHQLAPAGDEHVHLEDTLQFVLTRYWVLGTDDALRIAARSPAGKVHPNLQSVYERFRLVRVPLAKLKVAGDDALKDGRVHLSPPERKKRNPRFTGLVPATSIILQLRSMSGIDWLEFVRGQDHAAGDNISTPAFE